MGKNPIGIGAELYSVNWHHISDVVRQGLNAPVAWHSSRPRLKPDPALYPVSVRVPTLCSHCPCPRSWRGSHQHPPTSHALLEPVTKPRFECLQCRCAVVGCRFLQTYSEATENVSLQICYIKIPHTHTQTCLQEKTACSLSRPWICLHGTPHRSISSIYRNKNQSNQLFGITWTKYKQTRKQMVTKREAARLRKPWVLLRASPLWETQAR